MQPQNLLLKFAVAISTCFPAIAVAQEPVPTAPPAASAPATPSATASVSPAAVAAKVAATKAEAEKTASEGAKGDIDALRTGKLIASGLTGGVAFTVQFTGPFNNDSAKQDNPKGTVMPYVMVLPGYWEARQATREACASAYSGAGEDTIDSAARAITKKRATRIVADIESSVKAAGGEKANSAQIAKDLSLDYNGKDDETHKTNENIVDRVKAYIGKENAEEQKKDLIDSMAGIEWKAAKQAVCWPRRFGIWVGLPLNYEATTTVPNGEAGDTKQTESRAIKPVLAAGLGFTPNAYFSVLLGLTASTVVREATATKPASEQTIWATTLGIGGNLDIVTALAKSN